MLINSFAQAPFALLQATRRADLTAKLHLIELPLYALMILALGRAFGVAGVALAWTLRVSVDTLLLCWLNRRHLAELIPALDRSLVWLGGMIAILAMIDRARGLDSASDRRRRRPGRLHGLGVAGAAGASGTRDGVGDTALAPSSCARRRQRSAGAVSSLLSEAKGWSPLWEPFASRSNAQRQVRPDAQR